MCRRQADCEKPDVYEIVTPLWSQKPQVVGKPLKDPVENYGMCEVGWSLDHEHVEDDCIADAFSER